MSQVFVDNYCRTVSTLLALVWSIHAVWVSDGKAIDAMSGLTTRHHCGIQDPRGDFFRGDFILILLISDLRI